MILAVFITQSPMIGIYAYLVPRPYNICHTLRNPDAKIVMSTRPTPVQEKAFRLLNVNPGCTQ
jgi:hypothetical protein